MSSFEMGSMLLTRQCARCVPMPPVQSSLYSYTVNFFCKVDYYTHFINKKVPKSGLHWVMAFRPSQSGEEESWILREVGRTN